MASAEAQFLFQAMKPDGSKTLGVRASSEGTLAEDLRRDGLILLKSWKLPGRAAGPRKWSLADEFNLNDQLSIMVSRGVPLTDALEVCASVVHTKNQPRVMKMLELVAAGSTFADACVADGGFDDVSVAVYRSAERSGDLAGAARRLADAARRRREIASRSITVMIYPSVVAAIGFVIVFCMLAFIVPMLASQIEEMEANINWFSAIVFATGKWINANIVIAIGLILVAVLMIVVFRGAIGGAVARIIRIVPAVKNLMLTVETARFFAVMGAMTRSGVPLAEALTAANSTISNPTLREQLEKLRINLVEGGVLRNLIEDITALPLATRRLLTAAERSGDLEGAFDALSEDLSDEVQTRSGRLLAIMEPLVIVLLFVFLGPLVIAIALPMMTARIGDV